MRRALAVTGSIALAACLNVKLPPPLPPEPPMPSPLQADAAPELVPTGIAGILAAPGADPNLFYVEEPGLWYRFHRGRWYQAFRWDGHWFPPEDVPGPLRAGPPSSDPAEK